MKSKAVILLAGAACVALAAALLAPSDRRANSVQGGEEVNQSKDVKADEPKRPADEDAVRKTTADFVKGMEKGDAKAVAAFWTEQGEYIGDDGTTIRGRKAIEAAYAKMFAKVKKLKLEITVESVRFPSKDTAVEEGYAKSFKGGSEQPTTSRYSVLHVREGGQWLMAILREWPDEGVSLRDLDWLIGNWEAKTPDAEVRTTYEWAGKKNSIRCRFTIKEPDRSLAGTQIILRDPRTGVLRAWLFDDDGGFGDSVWTRDGKRWLIEASGVQPDGGELTATNILTPVDKDSFSWQSTERTLDGEELPNIPPVKVTRVK